ncbi:MAG: hypothetical protein CL780_06885 [Chloroflexi bacterium]|nr:hypothetical protein [Chloroflexota bacterium]|tara:strand:+ start:98 stop:922 length:825 start_codon:yes stop_codon:yes gene_type:complete
MSNKEHWNKLDDYKEIHGDKKSYDPNHTESVRKIWNERGKTGKEKLPDKLQHQLEVNSLITQISKSDIVLDAGCGSGFSSRQISRICSEIVGIDFAKELIKKANSLDKPSNVDFQFGDITNLKFVDNNFDKVITQRVLINLVNEENQLIAVEEIHRVLKEKGLFLMLETNSQAIQNLNDARANFNLDPIIPPWHNKVIDESTFFPKIKHLFDLVDEVNLGNYFLITRLIHPLLVFPEKPSYDNEINQIAFNIAEKEVSFAKDFSQAKLYVLQKL